MSLTTPVMNKYDPAFPGELWFLYWKTAPSMWESKLQSFPFDTIFIPIYWGLHTQGPKVFDFGTHSPELDLARLVEIAENCGKRLVLMLPLGPLPFVANGGLPPHLVFSMAIDDDGLGRAVIDSDDFLHKIYSFYDPRVYQSFRKFVWALSQHLSERGVCADVYGLEAGHMVKGRFISFFEDYSRSFEEGFARFLQQQSVQSGHQLELTPEKEVHLKEEFVTLIRELYIESSRELLGKRWSKHLQIDFVGSKASDLLARGISNSYLPSEVMLQIEEAQASNRISSTVLLSQKEKRNEVYHYIKDTLSIGFFKDTIGQENLAEDTSLVFSRLSFFDIWVNDAADYYFSYDEPLGLRIALDRRYKGCYTFHNQLEFGGDDFEEEEIHNKIFFVLNEVTTVEDINIFIKAFLNGATVIVDKAVLSQEGQKRVQYFLEDNNIRSDSIKFLIPVHYSELGDGSLIIFDSNELLDLSLAKKLEFWKKLTDSLEIDHLEIDYDENIVFSWKKRMSSPYELSYVEIRRLSLYNPSSYKCKAHINSNKNFVLAKVLDQNNAIFKNGPLGIDVFLEAGASIAFDFGHIGD